MEYSVDPSGRAFLDDWLGGRYVFTGTMVADIVLGDVHSLKEKRGLVRPLVADLRRQFSVSAAEVGEANLHRRAEIGVAVVAGEAKHVREVLDQCERYVASRPEIELLSVRRALFSDDDHHDRTETGRD